MAFVITYHYIGHLINLEFKMSHTNEINLKYFAITILKRKPPKYFFFSPHTHNIQMVTYVVK